jgi:hypothetical protein
VAIAIIAIAMSATLVTINRNIKATYYLKNKNIAILLATSFMNEIKVGLHKVPKQPDKYAEKMTVFNKDWYIEATETLTENPEIYQDTVKIFSSAEQVTPLFMLNGFRYEVK